MVVSNIFYFHLIFEEVSYFDEHIFQRDWFNHLDKIYKILSISTGEFFLIFSGCQEKTHKKRQKRHQCCRGEDLRSVRPETMQVWFGVGGYESHGTDFHDMGRF